MSGRDRGKGKAVAKDKGVATSKNVTGGKPKKRKVVIDSDDEYVPPGEVRETEGAGGHNIESAAFWVTGCMVSPGSPDPAELERAEPDRVPLARDGRASVPKSELDASKGIFCSYRFINLHAHMKYVERETSVFKGVNVEKKFPLQNEMPQAIKDFMEKEHIEGWCELVTENASSELVWEIFCNAKWAGYEEAQDLDDQRILYARRYFFVFSPASIAWALQWPPLEGPCMFEETMKLNVDELVASVSMFAFGTVPDAPWDTHAQKDVRKWTVASGHLLRRARWLVNIVESWIESVSPQNNVRFEWLVMAMLWWQGERFDVPKQIYRSFKVRVRGSNRRAAGFGYLLKHLATAAGAEVTYLDRAPEPPRYWTAVPDPKKDEVVVESSQVQPKGAKKGKGKGPAVSEESGPSGGGTASLEAMMKKMMIDNDKKAEARWLKSERKSRSRAIHARHNQRRLGEILETHTQWIQELGRAGGVTLRPGPREMRYQSSTASDGSDENE